MSRELPTEAILTLEGVSKRFGAQAVLREVSLTVHEGDRIGLIGGNGSGKSTLLGILCGIEEPNSGRVAGRRGLRVGMLGQQCTLPPGETVGDVLDRASGEVHTLLEEHERLSHELARGQESSETHARYAALQHALDLTDGWRLETAIKRLAVELNLPEKDRTIGSLSGGERRRVDLAGTLLRRPDLLLLDEPTNQIDVASARWIESYLAQYSGTCVLVTHDRYFLDRVVNRIVELEEGALRQYAGGYEAYLAQKTTRQANRERTERNRAARIRRELAWLRRGPKARTSKQKARIQRFDRLESQEDLPVAPGARFAIPEPSRLGKLILEAEGISRAYGDNVLFRDFSLLMQKGMRVGVVGPNGCGKTTLLRVLMGEEPPDSGRVIRGEATRFLYVDQTHEEIDPSQTILQHVTNGAEVVEVNGQRIFIPTYLEQFLFDRGTLRMPMERISGGERNRIDIAKKLLFGGNFLVLDEPTNDLDLPTLRVLEEAVLAFNGCAILVSHDRYFLNRLCTHLLVFEGDGRVLRIAGNYDDYERYLEKQPSRPDEPAEEKPRPRRARASKARKVRRLTWHEKKELDRMGSEIAAAEEQVHQIEKRIGDPAFFAQAHDVVQEVLGALAAARARVERLYDRWEELEALDQAP